MQNDLISALNISITGSIIVFSSILLLWGLISILTFRMPPNIKNLGRREKADSNDSASTETEEIIMAAIAGVTIAISLKKQETQPGETQDSFPEEEHPSRVSPWQSVMRANMLNKRGRVR